MFKHRKLEYIFCIEHRNELFSSREDLKSYSSGKVRDRKDWPQKLVYDVHCVGKTPMAEYQATTHNGVDWTTPPHFSMHLNRSHHPIA